MAAVVTPYTITDGNTLDPALYNSNIYSTTGDQGIMSEPNGGLDTNNFTGATALTVYAEHIRPNEAIRVNQDYMISERDYFNDAIGENGNVNHVPIAGYTMKTFVPFQASQLLWAWSGFWHVFRFMEDNGEAANVSLNIRSKMYLDGASVAHTIRAYPETAYLDSSGAATPVDESVDAQTAHAQWFDMHHMSPSGATAGWHRMELRLYMEMGGGAPGSAGGVVHEIQRNYGGSTEDIDYTFYNRLSFTTSQAMAIAFV